MSQSKTANRPQLKEAVAIVIIALAGLTSYFFLATETSCTYQNSPGGASHNGQQTYWEKLVGGICHTLPTGTRLATST